jgi:hypothetical protein
VILFRVMLGWRWVAVKTSEFLAQAKGVIETEGWIQGDLFNALGVCPEGAMKFAAIHHMTPGWHEGRKAFRDKIYEMYGELSISRWNDEPGRTKREVLEVFEKTIIGLEERGQ